MQVRHAHEVRDAGEALVAAVAELDPSALPLAACQELWVLGDRLEGICPTLASEAAARLSDGTPPDEDGPDRLSHPLPTVER